LYGTRQPEEGPLAGYTVYLYMNDDRDTAVQTTTTAADGRYEFKDIAPGEYVVGIISETVDELE